MNEKKTSILPKAIKIILDVIYGGLLFAMIGLIAWIAISPTLINRTGIGGSASIPVSLGPDQGANLELDFEGSSGEAIRSAWVSEARGILRLETSSAWLLLLTNGSKLVLAAGLAYIFYLLRKLMGSILDGAPFQEGSSRLIRRLGYTVLVVGFGCPIVEGLAAQAVLKRLPGTIPELHAAARVDPRMVIGAALLIFLLSQIWTYGLELERDRALTV